jgi:hypothetical protein
MMNNKKYQNVFITWTLLWAMLFPCQGWGQEMDKLWPEDVFVHLSDPVALTGDQLWLAISVKSHGQASPSAIVYLELLDKEGTPVKQVMAGLTEGQAEAYLEVPSHLSSDNYLLRVYTRNSPYLNPDHGIHHQMVTVINPQSPPSIVDPQPSMAPDTPAHSPIIQTDKRSYGPRQKVSLTLELDPNSTYHLAVRQLSPLPVSPPNQWKREEIYDRIDKQSKVIPELYGHIVQGKSLASKVDTAETFFLSAHGKQSNLFLTNPLSNGDHYFETGAFRHFNNFNDQSSR